MKELYHSTFLGQTSVHLTVIADPNAVSLWLLKITVGKSDEKQGQPRSRGYRCPHLFQGKERQTTLGIRVLKKAKSTEDKEVLFISICSFD